MDSDYLKARSIELAERAYRLRDRAHGDTRLKLDDAGDNLIAISKSRRFLNAQDALEVDTIWQEDMRSLAHEMNVSNNMLENRENLTIEQAFQYVTDWVKSYQKSDQVEVRDLGSYIDGIQASISKSNDAKEKKDAFNDFLGLMEIMLTHAHQDADVQVDTLYSLRAMRDAFLVGRELLIDDVELLGKDLEEGNVTHQINIARQHVNELYGTIKRSI